LPCFQTCPIAEKFIDVDVNILSDYFVGVDVADFRDDLKKQYPVASLIKV